MRERPRVQPVLSVPLLPILSLVHNARSGASVTNETNAGAACQRISVLPVIDLLGGQVVRGVGGRRAEYRPIESRLCAGSEPGVIAAALAREFGFGECYVADLDAIAGAEPNWLAYEAISRAGPRLWVDAGASANELAGIDTIARVIVGLESLADWDRFDALLAEIGAERFVFSLDLKGGEVFSDSPIWRDLSPLAIGREAIRRGAKSLIVLDLAGVGASGGLLTLDLCQALRASAPQAEIISGGGVRDAADLRALARAGCDRALVASALHDGRLLNGELQAMSYNS